VREVRPWECRETVIERLSVTVTGVNRRGGVDIWNEVEQAQVVIKQNRATNDGDMFPAFMIVEFSLRFDEILH